MTRFGCSCGKTIHLTVVPNPNEGRIVRDQDIGDYYTEVGQDVAGFIQAILSGHRLGWIAKRYNIRPDDEPLELSDADVVEDIMMRHRRDLDAIQCPYCGRLWVEDQEAHKYRAFQPEGEWMQMLKARDTRLGHDVP